MRYPRKWQLAVVCLLALALIPFTPAPRSTAQAPGYTLTDLGTLGSGVGEQSRAFGLDECGRVVGEAQAVAGASAPFRPFLWNNGLTDLGTLGGSAGTAYAINQSGTVTGSAQTSGNLLHPFVRYAAAPMFDLGTLPGGFTAEGRDINAAGHVVGVTEEGSSQQDRAFIWIDANGNQANDSNEMQALSAPWGTPIRAFGINDAGQVAGSANLTTSGTHAFVTIGGVAVDLGTLGGAVSVATEVNDAGEVAGYSYIFSPDITQSFHGFFWKDTNHNGQSDSGEMLDLGVLSGDRNSYAYDLNNAGLVVGASETGTAGNNVSRAFIWSSTNGIQDLNVVAPGTGWTFQEARGINNRGQIVGTGINPNGKVHAFLLTPTNVGPSPCDVTPTAGTLAFSAATYAVGENAGSVIISVSRTGGSDGAVSVNYTTSAGGTATVGTDYTATSGTLNFANGETTKTFPITINDDTTDEPDETVNLTLSSPTGGATLGAQSTAVLTIEDNDAAPSLSISDAPAVVEGDVGTVTATFTVTLSAVSGKTVTVSYASADGSATTSDDYLSIGPALLTFNPGETQKTLNVTVKGDTLFETDEVFFVNLTAPQNVSMNATIADSQGQGTITNDDAPPTLQFSSLTYNVDENVVGGKATLTVIRSGGTNGGVSVNFAVTGGTATANGVDYANTGGTLNFTNGDLSKTIDISINDDTIDEENETVILTLSNPTGGGVLGGASTTTLTINDNDAPPALLIGDPTVAEGNSGTVNAVFQVAVPGGSGKTVTVDYATANGSAVAPDDYTATSGTLTFNPGESLKTINVPVKGDTTFESDETFVVNLSNPTNATIGDGQGQGTITNDEALSTFQFTAGISGFYSGSEGGNAVVTVTRSGSTAGGVFVNYSTASGGTATNGSDYTATSGTLFFAEGETEKSFNVSILQDTLFEGSESVNLALSGPFGGTLGAASTSRIVIEDDDTQPTLQFSAATYNAVEGAGTATITVTRTGGTNGGVTVGYSTSDGTANAGSDYAATSGVLTFAEGETSKTFTVAINDDAADEESETVNLALLNPGGGGRLGTQTTAVLTIIDNDGAPTLFIDDVSASENLGVVNFTVTLSPASGQTVTVNYATADGTATAGSDYVAKSGTLTFNPGELVKTVAVSLVNDTSNEPDETFFVNLSGATNTTISDAQGQGTILNDDTPKLRFAQSTIPANESAHFVTVTVQRSGDPSTPINVDFVTSDGTASERKDYTAAGGTLRFAAGETQKTFDVLLTDDAFQESDETIIVTLSNPVGGAIDGGTTSAGIVIAANDNPPPNFNPIDISSEFVRQHYHDFLNREPDAPGLAFWVSEIENCGADAQCREVKRINVSAAFFLSIEFQETGYLVERTYKTAFGDTTSPNVEGTVPIVRLNEFLPDTRRIGEDVIVNVGDWQAKLNANKNAYMGEFVQRQRFLTAFPLTMTAAEFVDKLNQNAGNVLTTAERDALVNDLSNGVKTRAEVLRNVSENPVLQQNEFRRAFVLMQYYGYLRRNPNDAPNSDFTGWKFWLDKLNQFNGNYVNAEMVKAFLDSIEYRTRFAP